MKDDLQSHIAEKYAKSPIVVVPGHLPKFKSKEHVDWWFETHEEMFKLYFDEETGKKRTEEEKQKYIDERKRNEK
jgi:hypothetical protein